MELNPGNHDDALRDLGTQKSQQPHKISGDIKEVEHGATLIGEKRLYPHYSLFLNNSCTNN